MARLLGLRKCPRCAQSCRSNSIRLTPAPRGWVEVPPAVPVVTHGRQTSARQPSEGPTVIQSRAITVRVWLPNSSAHQQLTTISIFGVVESLIVCGAKRCLRRRVASFFNSDRSSLSWSMLSHPPIIDRLFDSRPEILAPCRTDLGVKGAAELGLSIRVRTVCCAETNSDRRLSVSQCVASAQRSASDGLVCRRRSEEQCNIR